jgi:hypothetical protein
MPRTILIPQASRSVDLLLDRAFETRVDRRSSSGCPRLPMAEGAAKRGWQMKPWMRYVGGFGLSIDLAFHWSAADSPGSPGSVLRELFVDTDPGAVWWLTALGVAAHVMFFGVFAFMLLTSKAAEPSEKLHQSTSSIFPSRTAAASSSRSPTTPENLEHLLHEHLAALGPVPRADLLHVLLLPHSERAERIGGYYADRRTRTLAQLLTELEESPQALAMVLGELRGTGDAGNLTPTPAR